MKINNKLMMGIGLVVILMVAVLLLRGSEDSWIKDNRGVYVEHGHPSKTPDYVLEQQELIESSLKLYNQEKLRGVEFFSQCLGSIGDYAVDIVHIPRIDEDNSPENQCEDYREERVSHFIELDKDGNIVRIV